MTPNKDAKLQALVKVVPTRVNVGGHPEFVVDDSGEYQMTTIAPHIKLRTVRYARDEFVDKFPVLVSPSRVSDVLEMNLFLIHRYIGQYSIKRNNTKGRSHLAESETTRASARASRVDIATVEVSAKHLAVFLRWLIDNDVDWAESLSEPLNDRLSSLELLPVWRFREDLMNHVESGQLSYHYASNRIQIVKTFYEWAWKNHRIKSIPFKHITKTIRKRGYKTSNCGSNLASLLFGMGNGPTPKGGIPVFTTNLALPRKIIQKQSSPEDGLQPYSLNELNSLISSDTLKKDNYALWTELGYRCGLRTMDIVQLNYEDLQNPDVASNKQFKITILSSKGNKERRFTLSRELMGKLWAFVNSDEYASRRMKYEIKQGLDSKLPLFINNMGCRTTKRSVSNMISIVRAEEKEKGRPVLKRSFHDLRATFATYLASYMLEAGYSDQFIKVTLTRELGHSNFETSQRYIDFAKTDCSFSNVASPWVTEIYQPLQALLCEETKELVI
ncbi:tyrosine-type recombinase/integrase [Vibrio sp. 10N.222.54.F6]|uniref:tyrosine-type recombinase/integrase n=1 Tax=Vibrio TaxID=662 RepID=UPI0002F688EA|nr:MULTISPECIES: site-specific integrase [Vibrio]OEF28216.1 transposase [Vibrio cyclitrophicus 1F97]PML76968.1 transposase [Vibrio sp. 10N.261.51.A7]